MKVIIIIVTYNGMKWYKKCFDSIQNSTIPLQTIIIDNNSSDGTVDFIKESYPEIHLIESNENLGFGKANNLGIEYAIEQNADYVYLLNQDAWVKPNTIERLVSAIQNHPEYGILSPIHLDGSEVALDRGFLSYINHTDCPSYINDTLVSTQIPDKIFSINFVNAAHWLMPIKSLLKIGGFDPLFFHYGEDLNYTNRVKYHGFKIGIYPQTFAIHDRNDNKPQKNTLKKIIQHNYIHYLAVSSDNNKKFISTFYQTQVLLFSEAIKNLFLFNFKKTVSYFCVSFKLVFSIFRIRESRANTKMSGTTYLKNIPK